MSLLKSHFVYDRNKRNGILFLLALIIAVVVASHYYTPEVAPLLSQQEAQDLAVWRAQIAQAKAEKQRAATPKIYPFNPNFISDYKGYTLGMSVQEIDRLHRFRESGNWINSSRDFQKVTKVSDSVLDRLTPYFKFPKWVTAKNATATNYSKRTWKTTAEKAALNSITETQLLQIKGVDSLIAQKVLRHIDQIGGYQIDQQLYDVYGVTTAVKRAILAEYTVKVKPAIRPMNVNTATASDLSTIPLLSFDLAKEIVDYRLLHEGIKNLEELKNLEGMTAYKFDRIQLYLSLE